MCSGCKFATVCIAKNTVYVVNKIHVDSQLASSAHIYIRIRVFVAKANALIFF